MATPSKSLRFSVLTTLLLAGVTNVGWAQEAGTNTREAGGIKNCEQLFANEDQYYEEMVELERRKQDAMKKFGERDQGIPESIWTPEQENRLNLLKTMFNNCQ